MKCWAWLGLVTIAACAAKQTSPREPLRTPPPVSLEAKPWKVGQWALYKIGDRYERIHITRQIEHGFCFQHERVSSGGRWMWRYCLRSTPEKAAEVSELVFTIAQGRDHAAFDLRGNEGAAKQALFWLGSLSAWPATGQRELVAAGESGTPAEVPKPQPVVAPPHETRGRLFFGLGFGSGHSFSTDEQQSSGTRELTTQMGSALSTTVDLVFSLAEAHAEYSPDPSLTEGLLSVLAGVRWSPWRSDPQGRGRFGKLGLYGRIGIGYGQLDHSSEEGADTVARGFALGAGIGWTYLSERDWTFGIELVDRIEVFNSGEGLRHQLVFGFQLDLYYSTF